MSITTERSISMTDIMIDIETVGTRPYSGIVSIAAVEFDIETGECKREFYEIVSMNSCEELGFGFDHETMIWWFCQDSDSKLIFSKENQEEALDIDIALTGLKEFFSNYDRVTVWANSPSFDLSLLKNAYEKCSIPCPWNFYQERDVRTYLSIFPEIKKDHTFKGVKHSALDDCYNQTNLVSRVFNKLKDLQR
jgi:DNA polymerase III epsilon subunit-like protein